MPQNLKWVPSLHFDTLLIGQYCIGWIHVFIVPRKGLYTLCYDLYQLESEK